MYDETQADALDNPALAHSALRAAAGTDACAPLLLRLLDEIDYGLMLVGANGRVRIANRPARVACSGAGPLRLAHQRLDAPNANDQASLARSLAGAKQGRRTMLRLGSGAQAVDLAIVPINGADDDEEGSYALVVIGKRQVCEALSVEFFARAHRLTTAESNVLQALCSGLGPSVIARQFGVAVSTIRTQVSSIRLKTDAASIRELVKRVTVLPPIVTALRGDATAALH